MPVKTKSSKKASKPERADVLSSDMALVMAKRKQALGRADVELEFLRADLRAVKSALGTYCVTTNSLRKQSHL